MPRETGDSPRRTSSDHTAKEKPRREIFREMGIPEQLPDVDFGDHVLNWLIDMGITTQGFNSVLPLPANEITYWLELTGYEADSWERYMIYKLSQQYCYQTYAADRKDCAAPFGRDVSTEDMALVRKRAEAKIRDLF